MVFAMLLDEYLLKKTESFMHYSFSQFLRVALRASCLCLPLFLLPLLAAWGQVNVLTYHNDNARTGQNLSETLLTPQTVNAGQFGRLFSQPVDGQVYAQPLYVANVNVAGKGAHNVLLVATQHDSVYAFDADSSAGANAASLWQRSFVDPANGIAPVSSYDARSTDISPEVGITGTPVIRLGTPDSSGGSTGTIYFVTKTKETVGTVAHFVQRLRALDITTGLDVSGSPVLIADTTQQNNYTYVSGPSVPGTGDGSSGGLVQFNALRENQRPGLVLANNTVYVAFASHGDSGPYHGWVLAFDAGTLQPGPVYNTTPNGGLGGIWMNGGAPAADGAGNLYFITGNGAFDADQFLKTNADSSLSPQPQFAEYGDSFLRLQPNLTFANYGPSSFQNHALDFFTPKNQAVLNSYDTDLGAGGLMLLPDSAGSPAHPHLLVGCGKQGMIYLLDRDNLGGFNLNADNAVQEWSSEGVWSSPAFWNGSIYYQGAGGQLKRFPITNGVVSTGAMTGSGIVYGFPGATPAISANGSSGGIVWTVQTDGYAYGGQAILHACDASNVSDELYNSGQMGARDNAGPAVKFAVPTVANGKVYVGATGQVSAYGVGPAPITATPAMQFSGSGFVGDTVTLTDATAGASIYYTTDGTDPTPASTLYIAPFAVAACETVKSKAIAPHSLDSAVAARFFGQPGPAGHGDGLLATYFHGQTLDPTAGATLTRIDPTVNFAWNAAPAPGFSNANYSVRWAGQVQPQFSDTYTFYTVSSSGCRLWVNDHLIVDDWTYHPKGGDSAAIALQAGHRYDIKVEYYQNTGSAAMQLSWSCGCLAQTSIPQNLLYSSAPDAPSGLTATSGDGDVSLAWSASPGATGYNVKRASTSGGPYTTIGTAVPAAQFNDTDVTNGQRFFYVVSALNTQGESANSSEASANPVAGGALPAAPANLQALAADSQVSLSWTAVSGVTSYTVRRASAASGPFTMISPAGSVISAAYADTTASNGQTFFYEVSAVNSAGEGRAAGPVSATPAAQIISYPLPGGFGGASGLQVNGSARLAGSVLRLTDGKRLESGSAFFTKPVGVARFNCRFQFQMTAAAAEGITFCLQSGSPFALGDSGGDLGYGGIGSSVAVKFDLANTAGEGSNSTGLYVNGVSPTVPATPFYPVNMRSGDIIAVTMSYDGATLSVTEADSAAGTTASQSYPVNLVSLLGSAAYAGFTGATGKQFTTQDILSWIYGPAAPLLTSIAVSPATASLNSGAVQQFSAVASDQYGTPLGAQPAFTWSLDSGGVGSVSGSGLYAAGSRAGLAAVRATAGSVSGTAQVSVTLPPQPPTGLSAVAVSPYEIDLAWTDVDSSQTSLKLERSTDSGATWAMLQTLAANASVYEDQNLTPATAYAYRLQAGSAAGDSTPSATAVATTGDIPPLQASNLVAKAASTTQINLTWQDNSGNESGFHIYRKTGLSGAFSLTATAPANAVSFQDTGLTPGTYYEYHLKAYNAVGEAADFAGSHATTLPPPPAALTAAVVTTTATVVNAQVVLSWPAVPGAITYNVYRGTTADGEATAPFAAALTTTTFTDTTVAGGQTYFYTVTAVDGDNDDEESDKSPEASATLASVPAVPTSLVITPALADVTLGTTQQFTATAYDQNGSPLVPQPTFIWKTSGGILNAAGLFRCIAAGGPYTISAAAGSLKATATVYVPTAPQSLTAAAGNGQVALSWTPPAGSVTSYTLTYGTVSGAENVPVANLTGTTATVTGLTNGQTYYFVVSAVNPGGVSLNSGEAGATPSASPVSAVTALTPIADSYVWSSAYASQNKGTVAFLSVVNASASSSNRCAYLKFDLTGLTLAPAAARLALTVDATSFPANRTGSIQLYGVSDTSWAERGINWNNAPGLSQSRFLSLGTLLGTQTATTTTGTTVNYDLTAFVASHLGQIVTLQLFNPNADSVVYSFVSREGTNGKPTLVLTGP